jgi:hypothetical protein
MRCGIGANRLAIALGRSLSAIALPRIAPALSEPDRSGGRGGLQTTREAGGRANVAFIEEH